MGNQRNSKTFKIVGIAVLLLVAVYVLYTYRQTANEASLTARHLRELKEEYAALGRRFDMLSNELKGTVQNSASLGKQLQLEKSAHTQTSKEKDELSRQCHTESIRLENEKAQVVKEKQQLNEDKDQIKRERDRLSSQLDTLTQECTEAKETAQSHQHQLQTDLEGRLGECQGRVRSLESEISTCRASAVDVGNQLQNAQRSNQQLQSHVSFLEERLGHSNSQGGMNPQGNYPQGGFNQQNPGAWQDGYGRQQPGQQYGVDGQPQNMGGQPGQQQPQHQSHRGQQYQGQPGQQQLQHQGQPGQQQLQHQGQPGQQQLQHQGQPEQLQQQQGQQPNGGGGGGQGGHGVAERTGHEESHHMTNEEKRNVYIALHDKVLKGVELNKKQRQVYQLLSQQYGAEGEHPAPQLQLGEGGGGQESKEQAHHDQEHVPGGIQQPPAPAGAANNEQEEVKDLVDGGQQKAEVFENVKEQPIGGGEDVGAREPNEDNEGGVELHDVPVGDRPHNQQIEAEDGDVPLPNPEGHGHPLPNPLENDGHREVPNARGKRKDSEVAADDEDVGDYGAVELEERKNPAPGNADDEEGHRAFLDDQKMYNQERRNLMRREAEDKENREERDGHWKELEHQIQGRREMR